MLAYRSGRSAELLTRCVFIQRLAQTCHASSEWDIKKKSLNLPSEYCQGDNRTVWHDIYSFLKWQGKLRCFFFFLLSKVYFIINSTCFVKCIRYIRWCFVKWACGLTVAHDATGVSCWTCMHGCRSVLLITPYCS